MYQTRSEVNGLKNHKTFAEAYYHAKQDASIWKISFNIDSNDRLRLVKNENGYFEVRQMADELEKYMDGAVHKAFMEKRI